MQKTEERKFRHRTSFIMEGRTLLIRLGEDLDHHNAVYIKEMADGFMEKHSVHTVIFDFTGVEFMDSSGIGVIMGRYKQVNYIGGCIKVTGIGKSVDRIFQMSGLYKLVKRYETLQEAGFSCESEAGNE